MPKMMYNGIEYSGNASNSIPLIPDMKLHRYVESAPTILTLPNDKGYIEIPDGSGTRPKNILFATIAFWANNTGAFSLGTIQNADGTTAIYVIGNPGTTITSLQINCWYYEYTTE